MNFQRFFLRLLRASSVGVRALVIRDQSFVLLVKHTYVPKWHLPGGGVDKNETVYDAVRRELMEEAGVTCLTEPRLFDVYYHQIKGVSDFPVVFVVDSFSQSDASSPEIEECRWFNWRDLPEDTYAGSRQRILEFFESREHGRSW